MIERYIMGEVYASSETINNLTVLCDEFGGRLAGTIENRKAAEFILEKYKEYGFENTHFESFKFPGCEIRFSKMEIISPIKKEMQCIALPMTESGCAEGEVIFIGYGTNIKRMNNLDGKIVMALTRQPITKVIEAGAEAFILMHPYPAMGPPTGCVPKSIPSVGISYENGSLINRFIKRKERVKVEIETESRHFERESWNICGEIPGNGKYDDFLIFGAHYDGHEIAQAAFDCGASCTAIIDMGRILNKLRKYLNRTIRIICFSAEEFGCWGSKDYVKSHSDEMEKLLFTYQLDCCGGGGIQMVTLDFWPELEPFFISIANDLNVRIPIDQRMGPGDSRVFFELGIPTGSILDYRKPGELELLKTYRHTMFDTIDKIDIRSLREAVTIGAISGLRIANSRNWPKHRKSVDVNNIKEILK